MGFLKKKSAPPPAPQLPPQPTQQEVLDVIDEIAGTQTVTVVGADGKKRRVTQRIPRTPQEEAMLKQADELMAQAVDNIQKLYRYDPASIVNYQPFINTFAQINDERIADLAQIGNFGDLAQKVNDFKNMSKELVNREFDTRSRMNDEMLARRGLQNSTYAAETKAFMARDKALARQQAAIEAERYGDDLMRSRLDAQNQLYDTRERGRLARLEQAQTGYSLERQKYEDEERARQNAIAENEAMLGIGRNMRGDELQRSQLALQYGTNAQNAAYNQNVIQNQRYNNEINRLGRQYEMDMERFNQTPRSFGRQLAGLGVEATGRMLGKAGSQVGSSLGASLGKSLNRRLGFDSSTSSLG